MTKNLSKLLLIVVVAAMSFACSGYNKLLKSDNKELMYNEALKFFEAKKYQKTLQLFEEISHYYTGTTKEDSILYYTGTSLYKMGDFESSATVFEDFRRRFSARSPFIEDVEYMYAKGFYYSSPQPERDQTTTHRAIATINEYLERYPNSTKKEVMLDNIDELTLRLHDKAFINASTYYKTGRYKSAVVALQNALDEYPTSSHREELMYLTAKSAFLLANNSLPALQKDRYLDMMDNYYNFAGEYPQSKYIKELTKMQEQAKRYLAQNSADKDKESKTTENTQSENGN